LFPLTRPIRPASWSVGATRKATAAPIGALPTGQRWRPGARAHHLPPDRREAICRHGRSARSDPSGRGAGRHGSRTTVEGGGARPNRPGDHHAALSGARWWDRNHYRGHPAEPTDWTGGKRWVCTSG